MDGEAELRGASGSGGERKDSVTPAGGGVVAAFFFDSEGEVARHLLGGLHAVEERTPCALAPAAALVEAELRVNEFASVADEPGRAVEAAALLVCGERDDDVAVWAEPLPLIPDEVGDEDGGHRLVINRAATVVVAFALRELERVEVWRPVLLLRLDNVEVREEKYGASRARAAQARDDVPLARVAWVDNHLHVLRGEPRGAQASRHLLGGLRRVADRVGRVRLDQLFVYVEEELPLRAEPLRRCGARRRGQGRQREREQKESGRGGETLFESVH